MAGIGLKLHKIAASANYRKAAGAYVTAAVFSTGPWLSTVIGVAILGVATPAFLQQEDRALLFATISYTFAVSLVVTGGIQMLLTRYLADRVYVDDYEAVTPTCGGVMASSLPLLLIAAPFVAIGPMEPGYRLVVASLFVTLCLTWLAMVLLSVGRFYRRIVLGFTVGCGLGIPSAILLGHTFGLIGTLYGFALGQLICLVLLILNVYYEYPGTGGVSIAFLQYARTHTGLILIGLLYMTGIWLDNVVYWMSSEGVTVAHFYHVAPSYDISKLLGYLTTVPAAAYILANLEARFYVRYRRYFGLVVGKSSLGEIREAREQMTSALRTGIAGLLRLQAIVASVALVLAPWILDVLRLPTAWSTRLRIEVVATNGQFLLLLGVLLLLYLDERSAALLVVGTFAAANLGLSLMTLLIGPDYFGTGYLVATLTGTVLAFTLLRHRLRSLDYRTFMLQPLHPHVTGRRPDTEVRGQG